MVLGLESLSGYPDVRISAIIVRTNILGNMDKDIAWMTITIDYLT